MAPESGIRGVLRGFGLKVGAISRGRFEARIRDLVEGQAMLETVIGSMLAARAALQAEFTRLHRALLAVVRVDPVCRQLMSVPGVGAALETLSPRTISPPPGPIGPGDGPRLKPADVRQSLQMEDMTMPSAFDFAPFRRSTVGFDRLFDLLENSASGQTQDNYPPFDLVSVDENRFRICLAVAGFTQNEIDITAHQNQLIVSGEKREDDGATYIHRGIANRAFERRIGLADHIKVTGADMKDGLLSIELTREIPEAMKPRKIDISGGETHAINAESSKDDKQTTRRVSEQREDA